MFILGVCIGTFFLKFVSIYFIQIFLAGAAEASSVGKKSRGTSNSRHTVPLESLPVSKSEVMNVVPIEVREDSISLVSAEALTTPPTYEDHGNGI